ncbi:methyltransferase [Candidatus Woesearchaeota archaeon]|nr:methyltransferase [Candidatus Woesearchaeota archaeon]
MDHKASFGEVLSFLREFYPDLGNYSSETVAYFLSLPEDVYLTAQSRGLEAVVVNAPKRVKKIHELSDSFSFPSSYSPASRRENAIFFGGVSEKKGQEVVNYARLFESYGAGIDLVLDVACGVGHLGAYLKTVFPGLTLFGIDINAGYLVSARRKNDKLRIGALFVERDAFQPLEDLMIGGKNAVVSLHGCGGISQRILRIHSADLLMTSPCCYNRIPPEDYFMSEYGKQAISESGIKVDHSLGEIAILGHGFLNSRSENAIKMRLEVEVENGVSELDEALLKASNCRILDAESIHSARRRYALLKKMFFPVVEALFSLDKAIYLNESGYESHVFEYVPPSITPRNHLVIGRK